MLFKTNDEKFSLGRVKSKKICRLSANLFDNFVKIHLPFEKFRTQIIYI